jgi:hypothetical protein
MKELDTMRSKFGVAFTALGLVTGALALSDPAQAQGVQVGALTCNVESGFGFIVGSSRTVDCTFSSPNGPPQHYVGSIRKLGIDIGYLQSGVMVWSVVAPTINFAPGSLSGSYGGVTAGMAVGIGAFNPPPREKQPIRTRANEVVLMDTWTGHRAIRERLPLAP